MQFLSGYKILRRFLSAEFLLAQIDGIFRSTAPFGRRVVSYRLRLRFASRFHATGAIDKR